MKPTTILGALFMAMLMAMLSAIAQTTEFSGGQSLSFTTGTNTFAAASSTNYTLDLDVRRASQFWVWLRYKSTGTDTGAVTLTFHRSPDGTLIESASTTVALTANGATAVDLFTNLTVGAESTWRLATIANSNTNAITNLVIRAEAKR